MSPARPPFRHSPRTYGEFMTVLRYTRGILAEELESAKRTLERFDERYPEASAPSCDHPECAPSEPPPTCPRCGSENVDACEGVGC